MNVRRALACLASAFPAAIAAAEPQWPPPPAVQERMRELQQVIVARDSTREQRDAARAELGRLIGLAAPAKAPSAAPRAAIDPFPSVPAPRPAARVPTPPVAELEVVSPPRPVIDPATGAALAPSGRVSVDPRTGNLLHETPGGYIDPRTGRLIAR